MSDDAVVRIKLDDGGSQPAPSAPPPQMSSYHQRMQSEALLAGKASLWSPPSMPIQKPILEGLRPNQAEWLRMEAEAARRGTSIDKFRKAEVAAGGSLGGWKPDAWKPPAVNDTPKPPPALVPPPYVPPPQLDPHAERKQLNEERAAARAQRQADAAAREAEATRNAVPAPEPATVDAGGKYPFPKPDVVATKEDPLPVELVKTDEAEKATVEIPDNILAKRERDKRLNQEARDWYEERLKRTGQTKEDADKLIAQGQDTSKEKKALSQEEREKLESNRHEEWKKKWQNQPPPKPEPVPIPQAIPVDPNDPVTVNYPDEIRKQREQDAIPQAIPVDPNDPVTVNYPDKIRRKREKEAEPFDPAEEARKRKEREDRAKAVDAEYKKQNPQSRFDAGMDIARAAGGVGGTPGHVINAGVDIVDKTQKASAPDATTAAKVAAAASMVGAAVTAVSAVVGTANEMANKYAQYSPEIAQAQALAEVREMMGDMRRAREGGAELAEFVKAQSEMQNQWENVKMAVMKKLVPVVSGILKVLSDLFGLASQEDETKFVDPTTQILKHGLETPNL